jgi:cysteine desulfurase
MLANNEIGAIHPMAEVGAVCREQGVPLHCDATQAVGKIPVDVEQLQVDLMSFTAHKIYGPKGIGALYLRRRPAAVRLEAQLRGGGHEGGLRSGTLNVAGIVGFARAMTICSEELAEQSRRLASLRRQLYEGITRRLSDVALCGPALEDTAHRLPHNLTLSFGNVDGEALLMSMEGLAVSSGAACTSVNSEPSHVLRALGLPEDLVRSSLRFGLGRFNTAEEVQRVVEMVAQALEKLRQMSSLAP